MILWEVVLWSAEGSWSYPPVSKKKGAKVGAKNDMEQRIHRLISSGAFIDVQNRLSKIRNWFPLGSPIYNFTNEETSLSAKSSGCFSPNKHILVKENLLSQKPNSTKQVSDSSVIRPHWHRVLCSQNLPVGDSRVLQIRLLMSFPKFYR